MSRRSGTCDHCGRHAKVRPGRFVTQLYCTKCWERFGGGHKRTNRLAARRRAIGR
jgi:hypothetical protein